MSGVIDQMARDNAQKALGQISAHEELCAERYSNIHSRLGQITKILGWGGTTLAGVMIALIGFLAVRAMDANTELLQAKLQLLQQQVEHPAGSVATQR